MATRLGRDFDRLSLAAGASNLADGTFVAAFPLLIATLTRDPLVVAGASLVGRLPWFLLALPAGALVDRLDRRKVMLLTNALRGVGVGMLTWAVASDRADIPLLYVVAFALGVSETFFDTSSEALVPRLVGTGTLPSANSRLQAIEWVGNNFVGPPVGGFLFAAALALPFAMSSGFYLVSAAVIALVAGTHRTPRTEVTTLRHDIAQGVKWLWGQRVVRTLSLMAGAANLTNFAIVAVFVLYAQDVLGATPTTYGVLLSTLGVGGLAGAALGPRVVASLGPGIALRVALITQATGMALITQTRDVVVAGTLMFLFGVTITIWNVVAVSLRQELTPDELRGRVAGASRLLAWGTQPLGALIGGWVATAFGLRAPFVFAAAVYVLTIVLTWRIISNVTIDSARSTTG